MCTSRRAGGSMPISGVSTSCAAFVGFTKGYNPDEGDQRDPDGHPAAAGHELGSVRADLRRLTPRARCCRTPSRGSSSTAERQAFIVRIPGGAANRRRSVLPPASGPTCESLRSERGRTDGRPVESRDRHRRRPPPKGGRRRASSPCGCMENGQQREEFTGLTLGRAPSPSSARSPSPADPVKVARGAGDDPGRPAPGGRRYALPSPPAPSRVAAAVGTDRGRPHRLPGPRHRDRT